MRLFTKDGQLIFSQKLTKAEEAEDSHHVNAEFPNSGVRAVISDDEMEILIAAYTK